MQFAGGSGTIENYGTLNSARTTNGGSGGIYAYDRSGTDLATVTANLYAGSTTGAITLSGGNDTVALYTGTGTANAGVVVDGARLQNAGTLAAASFGTIALGGGSNTLNLRGTGDGTAPNGAAGALNMSTVSGLTTLSKQDAGTFVLTGSYAGSLATTVTGGRLVASNTGGAFGTGTNTVAIGANTTVELSSTTGSSVTYAGTTFSGGGTLQKIGSGEVRFGGSAATNINLSQGGLIDVQAGTLRGGNNNQAYWAGNRGSLNIASGAVFDGVEGGNSGTSIIVDKLTGLGTLQAGYGGVATTIQIGVANGDATLTGPSGTRRYRIARPTTIALVSWR